VPEWTHLSHDYHRRLVEKIHDEGQKEEEEDLNVGLEEAEGPDPSAWEYAIEEHAQSIDVDVVANDWNIQVEVGPIDVGPVAVVEDGGMAAWADYTNMFFGLPSIPPQNPDQDTREQEQTAPDLLVNLPHAHEELPAKIQNVPCTLKSRRLEAGLVEVQLRNGRTELCLVRGRLIGSPIWPRWLAPCSRLAYGPSWGDPLHGLPRSF